MDNKFYQDDELEQFLQDEVKQHRMYPSDHIWKNIRTELHGNKSWPALTFISLFILTALTISTLLNNHPVIITTPAFQPNANVILKKPVPANAVAVLAPAETTADEEQDYFQSIDPAQVTAETFANAATDPVPELTQELLVARDTRIDAAAVPVKINSERLVNNAIATAKSISKKLVELNPETTFVAQVVFPAVETIPEETKAATITPDEDKQTVTPAETTQPKKPEVHSSADEFLKDFNYITNKPKPRNSKFGIQIYVTPSTSYRKLSDAQVKDVVQPATGISNSAVQNIPLSTSKSADVNNVVRHKPAIGIEAGFAILYNMSTKLKFKTGLQLNVRQYHIETFQSRTSDLSSMTLINLRGVETISFYSDYNNNTGYKKTRLDNKVYQVSLPLGIQWDALKGKHFGITAEASVQPTLTMNTNSSYLLSTDYKHYTTNKDLIRKWNINTAVGVNLTYQSGKASWQLGPQVRYQHMSTYSNQYPIKEYLMDYGIRLGYTRQINR